MMTNTIKITLLAFASTAAAQAAVLIPLSFNGGTATNDYTATVMDAGDSTGPVALLDSLGAATGVSLSVTNNTNLDLLNIGGRLIANETSNAPVRTITGGDITLTFSGLAAGALVDISGAGDAGNANFDTNWTVGGSTTLVTNATASFAGLAADGAGNLTIVLTQSGNTTADHISIQQLTLCVPVPEPSSALLLGLGGLALVARRRK